MKTSDKTFVSIITPCYNEEAILKINIEKIAAYMRSKADKYDFEILIINDGSKDASAQVADALAAHDNKVRAIHHPSNMNLGHALRTGFKNANGDVIVVLDIDLSYDVYHIEAMVDKLNEAKADLVLASPYMKGGKVTAVPFLRKVMSSWVNRFMRMASQDNYHTFTAMARAYRSDFIKPLNLKTKDYEISPEIVYKAMILRAKIVEIPAHLDWTEQNKFAGKRSSSLRVLRSFFSGLMSGFIFRPYIFFMGIGAVLMVLSLYELVWLLYDTLADLSHGNTGLPPGEEASFSHSLALQFKKNPQSFLVGGITFVIAIQFLSVGFLSLQNKRYFEELFHLGSTIKKQQEEKQQTSA
jgi:dolichol-phosphate mannosyltransferase